LRVSPKEAFHPCRRSNQAKKISIGAPFFPGELKALKKALFSAFFETRRRGRRRYFQGRGLFGIAPGFVLYWEGETGHFWQITTPSWKCLNTKKMGRTHARLAMIEAP
jgi:hypothetical protein